MDTVPLKKFAEKFAKTLAKDAVKHSKAIALRKKARRKKLANLEKVVGKTIFCILRKHGHVIDESSIDFVSNIITSHFSQGDKV